MSYSRPSPTTERMMVSLKVDNLMYRTKPEDLKRLFEKCGKIGDIYIPRHETKNEGRGFAFVRFYDKRDAEYALDSMNGRMLDGRKICVRMARYKRPTPSHRRRCRRSRSPRRRSYSRSRSRGLRSRSYSRSLSRSRSRSGYKISRGHSNSVSR